MKKTLFIFLMLLMANGLVVAQSNGKITGVVKINNSVLHGAEVKIVQLNRSTHTDTEGRFEFADVPHGRYTVLAHMEGFSDATKQVTVAPGQVLTLDFDVAIESIREQVTVTASGAEQSVFESLQSVNSVGSTRITERASTSIGEVLESETGVAKRSFGPGSARPVVRGFDGDRVLVLQDGVRSGSLGSQSGDHGETIDPLAAERIEVVKGPGTLLYGSNAIGGVVNVIGHHDDQPHAGFRGFFTGVAGTADGQVGGSGGIEYGYKKWLFRGNFGAQRTGDYDTPIGTVPNSAARSTSGSFGAGYYGENAFFGGSYGYDNRRYGIPFAALFEAEEEPEIEQLPEVDAEIDVRAIRHNFRFNGGFRNLTNPVISGVNYYVDYTDYTHSELETEEGIESIGTVFDNEIFSYRSMFEQQRHGSWGGRFGFEGFHRTYQATGAEQLIDGEVKQNSFSVFGLEELNFERVKVQFGGRVETNRYRPENPDLIRRSFTAFSGGAGVNVGLWEGGAFVFNYNYGNRAPSLEELYNNGPHIGNVTFEIGDPNLLIERSNGVEFSLRHQSERFRFHGDIFYYHINNFVFLAHLDEDGDGFVDIEDGLPIGLYTQAKARYWGAEVGADMKFNDHLGAFVGLDMVRAELTDLENNVPRIPPARARVGLDIRYKGLSVRPEGVFAGRQDRVFLPLETETAGYGLFNVAASYTIGRPHVAHVFTVFGYNLTNTLYRNHVSFVKDLMPEIGRGVRFGYTVRFF
jgi:iron complex outermembrane receptor protein